MNDTLAVIGLGRMPYGEALTLQRSLAHRKVAGELPQDVLLLVEHPPVVTLGRGFKAEHLSTPREFLKARHVEIFEAERGGDVTFHGPGQLVGYPIVNLANHKQDLHWFLRQIEAALIAVVEDFGIPGGRREGLTGVWTSGRKIASIGIHVKQWVTWHGFALNVMTDLSYFDLIVPCGIPDVVMTSLQKELGERTPRDLWSRAIDQTVLAFGETFGRRPQMCTLDDLAVTA